MTHRDVAERAGVSTAVVSYVVNNGPRPVAPETRAKVEEAIRALGYYPNELARSLRLQQSSTIGLIIPDLTNPVYAEIACALEGACTLGGYLMLLCNTGRDATREEMFVRMLRAKQVDGVVLIPTRQPLELIRPLEQAHVPTVVLEHDLEGHACVALDDLDGGRQATQHLLSLGHRRIAFIKRTPTSATSRLRALGYRQALEGAGIAYDPTLVVESAPGLEAGYRAMKKLLALPERPTAVFTHNDVLAMAAAHAIREARLSIPEDISLVGYDDTGGSAYLVPPLTSIHYPTAEMGLLAAEMILDLAQNKENTYSHTTILPVELVVRASTAPPPVNIRR